MVEFLKQPQFIPVPLEEEVAILWAVTNGFLDEIEVDRVTEFDKEYIEYLRLREKKLLSEIADKKVLDEKIIKELEKVTKDFAERFKKGSKNGQHPRT